MTAKHESDLLIMIMITDRIGQHEILNEKPINQSYEKKLRKKLDTGYKFPLKKQQWTLKNARQPRTCDVFCPLTQAQHVICPFNCPITLSSYNHDTYTG